MLPITPCCVVVGAASKDMLHITPCCVVVGAASKDVLHIHLAVL